MHVLSPLFRITVLTLLLLCTPTKLKANDGKETRGHKEEPREAIGPAELSFRQGLRCDNELHQPMDAVRCYSMAEKLGHAAVQINSTPMLKNGCCNIKNRSNGYK